MKVLACVAYDDTSDTCTSQAWVEQPGLLPPLSVAQGLQLSGLMVSIAMTAWGFKFVRRYLSPRS